MYPNGAFAVEDELVEFVHEVEAESVPSFASILVHPIYITHYVAYHRHFTSQVVVVVWRSCVPGPAMLHGGKVVIFVHHGKPPMEKFEEWYSKVEAVPSANDLDRAKLVDRIIASNYDNLFSQHSNLTAIRVSKTLEIECIVYAKHFIPIVDSSPLPDSLDSIPVHVCSGYVEYSGQ